METIEVGTLEQTLSEILLRLANFFGTTVEAVSANAPEWLAKYGWYITLKGLPYCLTGAFLTTGFVIVCILMANLLYDGELLNFKQIVMMTAITFLISTVISIFFECLPAIVAPEIVGLERLIAIIK